MSSTVANTVPKSIEWDSTKFDKKSFDDEYSSKGYGCRKFKVIYGLPSSLIKAVYHLFLGIAATCAQKPAIIKTAKWNAFKRDLQEALGYITMVFNDKYGLFHIRKAITEKYNYDETVNSYNHRLPSLSLKDFKTLEKKERDSIIRHLGLKQSLNNLSKAGVDFEKFLNDQPENILEKMCIIDLSAPPNASEIYFQNLDPDALFNIPLNYISTKPAERNIFEFLCSRIHNIQAQGLSPKETKANTIGSVYVMSAENVAKSIENLSDAAIMLLRNDQVGNIDLQKISVETFTNLFRYLEVSESQIRIKLFGTKNVVEYFNLHNEVYVLRHILLKYIDIKDISLMDLTKDVSISIFEKHDSEFHTFPPEEVNEALIQDKICPSLLRVFGCDAQWANLEISKLSSDQLDKLFHPYYLDESDRVCFRKLFAKISSEEVMEALKNNKLKQEYLYLLSDEHLSKLDSSISFTKDQLKALFIKGDDLNARFSALNGQFVQKALSDGILDSWMLRAISDTQLAKMDIREIDPNIFKSIFIPTPALTTDNDAIIADQKRFSGIPAEQIKHICENNPDFFDEQHWLLFSREQLDAIDFSKINEFLHKGMSLYCKYKDGYQYLLNRFKTLKPETVQTFAEKEGLLEGITCLISREQFANMDITKFRVTTLDEIFDPEYKYPEIKEAFSGIQPDQLNSVIPGILTLNISHLISDEQLAKLEVSKIGPFNFFTGILPKDRNKIKFIQAEELASFIHKNSMCHQNYFKELFSHLSDEQYACLLKKLNPSTDQLTDIQKQELDTALQKRDIDYLIKHIIK